MNKLLSILAIGALASCGDNLKGPTDAKTIDTSTTDTGGGFPAAPTLGAQMDRMGRPAVNTVLNHGFDGTAMAGPAKDAYNQNEAVGTWPQSYVPAFMASLAMVDVLDTGLTCTNGTCTPNAASTPGDGCGNQVDFNNQPNGMGTPTATSYQTLATILSDDQLYLDTTKMFCDSMGTHQNYLSVEFNVVTGVTNQTCGGRDPLNDVIDTSYSVLAVGINGFNLTDGHFTPAITDGVGPHADVNDQTFPFLGPPHS
jgi:hypothetical protein